MAKGATLFFALLTGALAETIADLLSEPLLLVLAVTRPLGLDISRLVLARGDGRALGVEGGVQLVVLALQQVDLGTG